MISRAVVFLRTDNITKSPHRSKSDRKRVFFNSDPPTVEKENMGPQLKKSCATQSKDDAANTGSEQIEIHLTPDSGRASVGRPCPESGVGSNHRSKEGGDTELQASGQMLHDFPMGNSGVCSDDNINNFDRKTSSLSLSELIAVDVWTIAVEACQTRLNHSHLAMSHFFFFFVDRALT